MNVLCLDQFSEMGGAQHCLLDLVPAIAQRGGALFAAMPGRGPMIPRLQALGVEVSEIPCGPYISGKKSAGDAVRFTADLVRQTQILGALVHRHRIDLIYVNGPRLWPAAACISRGRIPAVFHLHNHIGQKLQARIAAWAIRRCNATVIACCNSVGDPLRRLGQQRFQVIPNGTRDCGYHARDFGRRGWRIGIIGRIAPEKGQLEFVEAAARLAPLSPGSRFVICGAPMLSDSRYFDRVRSAASGLPIDFIGWHDNVGEVLAELDALVISSSQEAMPRVMLEAFSAGVPVVAFNVGGIGEVIEDEVTGFLTGTISPAALANQIGKAIGDPERLRSIGARARSVWERSYTIDHYRRAMAREIDRALAPHGTRV